MPYIIQGFSLFIIIIAPLRMTQAEKLMFQEKKEETKHTIIIRNDLLDNKKNYGNKICLDKYNKKIKNFQFALWYKKIRQKSIEINYKVFNYINSDIKCKFLDYCISFVSYCDSKKINLSFLIILIVSIEILWNNKKDHFWIMLILLSSILAVGVILTHFLKCYFKSPRPITIFGDGNINIMFEILHAYSFPSGHTQVAFAICTFMFMTVKKYWYLYTVLSLGVAFERVYSGSHFPFDVLAGAAIGIIYTFIIVNLFKKQSKKHII
ncbi:MAG: phosphatase PAP2 family protein [Endomicrobium sp.]|jgi:undecaprenyl-diphosphatase|nr:phosphatase PAP2 family protein [Endomicrobium sp.]